MLSCLLPVEDVAGRRVTTLESLTPAEGLHPIQQAFLDGCALPVRLLHARDGHRRQGAARPRTRPRRADEIAVALAGNICRCTGYRTDRRGDRRRRRRRSAPAGDANADDDARAAQRRRPVGPAERRRSAMSPAGRGSRPTASFPGMLHLKMVRSPLHHARIRRVDTVRGRAGAGLRPRPDRRGRARTTGTRSSGSSASSPKRSSCSPRSASASRARRSSPILAETEEAALEAVSQVRLDLEELPAVFDVEEALRPGAPIVTHWGNNTFMYEGHPCRRVRLGDVEAAFATRRPHRRGRLRHEPDRARPDRDDRLHRRARGRTAGSPSTPTPRRSTSASTTPRSSCRSPATGSTSSAARSAAGSAARSTSSSSRSPRWRR